MSAAADAPIAEEAPWWIRGNYAPVEHEVTAADVPVVGELPEGLVGSYVRNGFNPPGRVPAHWFFGTGMVHGITIADGRASYRNRYVRTPYLAGDMDVFTAVGDLRASPANTHVVRHAGRTLALEEAHLPWELDAELGTVGCVDFDGALTTPMTAHPKLCPETGELLFFGYQFLREPWLTYHRADATGRLVQSEVIEIPRPVMMHDFTVTRNHAIFLDLPIVFSATGFGFDRDAGARLGVMPRDGRGADIVWYDIEPCSVFHVLNSYEDGDRIEIQVCRASSLMEGGMNDMGNQGVLWGWSIDTATGVVEERQLDDRPADFPRVDERRVGLPARFGYLASLQSGDTPGFGNEVMKVDLEAGTTEVHRLGGEAVHTFEPVFVPATPGAAEDEGWVLVLSHDDESDTTSLNVLDAQRFSDEPLARVVLPQRVPFGAHGSWFGAEA